MKSAARLGAALQSGIVSATKDDDFLDLAARIDAGLARLTGATTRQSMLSREHHGPGAIPNALERLASAYDAECTRTRQVLAIAECQLRDYQARLGTPFSHESYVSSLTALRDQLKTGLTATAPESAGESMPTVAELAEQIKALKTAHTIEASMEPLSLSSVVRPPTDVV